MVFSMAAIKSDRDAFAIVFVTNFTCLLHVWPQPSLRVRPDATFGSIISSPSR